MFARFTKNKSDNNSIERVPLNEPKVEFTLQSREHYIKYPNEKLAGLKACLKMIDDYSRVEPYKTKGQKKGAPLLNLFKGVSILSILASILMIAVLIFLYFLYKKAIGLSQENVRTYVGTQEYGRSCHYHFSIQDICKHNITMVENPDELYAICLNAAKIFCDTKDHIIDDLNRESTLAVTMFSVFLLGLKLMQDSDKNKKVLEQNAAEVAIKKDNYYFIDLPADEQETIENFLKLINIVDLGHLKNPNGDDLLQLDSIKTIINSAIKEVTQNIARESFTKKLDVEMVLGYNHL